MKVLIAPSSFGDTSLLKGYDVFRNPYGRKMQSGELIGDPSIGIIAGVEEYTAAMLASFPNLKCISRCGSGTDTIDLEAAKQLGIVVRNTPGAPARAVAELTVALIFNLLRGISFCDREIRKGNWTKFTGGLLQGKTVGILGYGHIGQEVEHLLQLCGVTVITCDIGDNLTSLLAYSDILTIHVSGNKCLIGAKEIQMMKRGAYLINTSRGGVVDEDALYDSLRSGHLAGAALDVFTEEPYCGKLKELDNVILTPHIGSYTKESRKEMECQSMQNLLEELEK